MQNPPTGNSVLSHVVSFRQKYPQIPSAFTIPCVLLLISNLLVRAFGAAVWPVPSHPCNGFAHSDGRLPRRFGTRTDVAVYVWLGLGVSSDEEGA